MKLRLAKWEVQKLNFSKLDEENTVEDSFGLKTGHHFPENNNKAFAIVFDIEIEDKKFKIELNVIFWFDVDEEISEEFKAGHFPKVNAPAISFPYLRAYISNLTLQSGFEPVILPAINFVELAKEKQ